MDNSNVINERDDAENPHTREIVHPAECWTNWDELRMEPPCKREGRRDTPPKSLCDLSPSFFWYIMILVTLKERYNKKYNPVLKLCPSPGGQPAGLFRPSCQTFEEGRDKSRETSASNKKLHDAVWTEFFSF